LGETTDLGNVAQFMVFVGYRATEDYVEQFFFFRPLVKLTKVKEMFEKVDSFLKNISFRGLCACLLVPMVLTP